MLINEVTIHYYLDQQVILPLLEQYVKNHRLYFLSTSLCSSGNRGHALKKEKEMIARYVSPPNKAYSMWITPAAF